MQGGKGLHIQTAQGKGAPRGTGMEHILQGSDAVTELAGGAGTGIDRKPELLGQGGEPRDVVRVFMGDEHAGEGFRLHPQGAERPTDAAAGDARINEDVLAPSREQDAVPGGTAGQSGECQQGNRSYVSEFIRRKIGGQPAAAEVHPRIR